MNHFDIIQIFDAGILIFAAYIGGLIGEKLKIGEIAGQILGGMLIGPHFLEIFFKFLGKSLNISFFNNETFIIETLKNYAFGFENFHFFVFMFLGIITFSLGEELHYKKLKKLGFKVIFIGLFQSVLTFLIVFTGFKFLFHFPAIYAAIIAGISIATAPAVIFILMQKLKIEGKLKNILANVVIFSDILEIITFSFLMSIASFSLTDKKFSITHLFIEIFKELGFAILIGSIAFFILKLFIQKRKNKQTIEKNSSFLATIFSEKPTASVEIFLLIFSITAMSTAISIYFSLPFLITTLTTGFLISNYHTKKLFDSLKIEEITPILNLIFFALIGANIDLQSFSTETLLLVIAYILFRSFAKIFGSWFACKITNQSPKITATLPKLMLPQAGMAAVETVIVASTFKNEFGKQIFNTVIPALVLFEIVGAWLTERTLIKWKDWITGENEILKKCSIIPQDIEKLKQLLMGNIYKIQGKDKESVIKNILEQLSKRYNIEPQKALKSILQREKLFPTTIGNNFAIPHYRKENIEKPIVIAGLLENEIIWNKKTQETANTIFLIITPDAKPEEHLFALKIIVSATKHKTLRQELVKETQKQLKTKPL